VPLRQRVSFTLTRGARSGFPVSLSGGVVGFPTTLPTFSLSLSHERGGRVSTLPLSYPQKVSRSLAFGFTEGDGVAVIQPLGCVVTSRTCLKWFGESLKGAVEDRSNQVLLDSAEGVPEVTWVRSP